MPRACFSTNRLLRANDKRLARRTLTSMPLNPLSGLVDLVDYVRTVHCVRADIPPLQQFRQLYTDA